MVYGILEAFRNSDVYQHFYESALSLIYNINYESIIKLSLIYGNSIVNKLNNLKKDNNLKLRLLLINNNSEISKESLSDFGVDINKLESSLLSFNLDVENTSLPDKLSSQDFLALVMQYLLIMKKSDEGGSA